MTAAESIKQIVIRCERGDINAADAHVLLDMLRAGIGDAAYAAGDAEYAAGLKSHH